MTLGDESDYRAHDLGDSALCVAMLLDLVKNPSTSTQLH